MNVGRRELDSAIETLALAGRPLCVHSSLRSFGRLDGGATTFIDAFLAHGCTLLVPTFTYDLEQPPPDGRACARNGWDYAREHRAATSLRFDASANRLSRLDMGAVPETLLSRVGRLRGAHPLNSFAALGPHAAALIECQTAVDVYAPLERLCELDGAVLLVGVDLTAATFIHMSEADAGRALFRRWALDADCVVTECRVGSCSRGFERLAPALAPLLETTKVGNSLWRLYPARAARRAVALAIEGDPSVTQCGRRGCLRCADAIAGGPR